MAQRSKNTDATGNQIKRDPNARFFSMARAWAKDNDLLGALELMGKDRALQIGKAVNTVRGAEKRVERLTSKLAEANTAVEEATKILDATAKVLPDVMKAAREAASKITGVADAMDVPAAPKGKEKGKDTKGSKDAKDAAPSF